MQTPFLRPIENHHLHWFNMPQSCIHDTIPQCIWKPCRQNSYQRPMCTWGILVIFCGHHGFGIKMNPPPPPQQTKTETYFQHQKQIRSPKISGIRGITLVSISHWSKSRNSTNPRCYFGGHLGFGIKMIPKHNFNTRNGFVALKLVGLEVLPLYLYHIGQNLGIPQIQDVILVAILDLASRWPPNIIFAPETDSSL